MATTRTPIRRPAPPRIAYLGFVNVEDSREYTYQVSADDAAFLFRFRIALQAFADGRALLQDGPDICYQKLVRDLALANKVHEGSSTVGDLELRDYRVAHTPASRRSVAAAGAGTAPAPAGVRPPELIATDLAPRCE